MGDPYEKLLKKAYAGITVTGTSDERFSTPVPKVTIEGKTTILENFAEIADTLRREPDHLMKHLVGELGTAGKIDSNRAIFNGKFESEQIKSVIKAYVEDYVICTECGKADTRLVKEGRTLLLRCEACGGHRPVRKRKARTEPATQTLEEGAVMDVTIQHLSRRGDGVVKLGRYTMYVANAQPGQTVKIKITRVAGSIAFTERAT